LLRAEASIQTAVKSSGKSLFDLLKVDEQWRSIIAGMFDPSWLGKLGNERSMLSFRLGID